MDWNVGIPLIDLCSYFVVCMGLNLGSDINNKIPFVIIFSIGSAIYGGALDHVLLLRLVMYIKMC